MQQIIKHKRICASIVALGITGCAAYKYPEFIVINNIKNSKEFMLNKRFFYPYIQEKKFSYIDDVKSKVENEKIEIEKNENENDIKLENENIEKEYIVEDKIDDKPVSSNTMALLNPKPIELTGKDALEQYQEMMNSGLVYNYYI